jgi:hypothetical protein
VPLGSSVTVNVKLPAPLGTDQQIPVVVFSQSATVGDAAAGRDITLAGADATDQVSSPKEAEMNKIAMVTLKFPAGTTSKAVTLTASSSAKVSQRVWLGLFSIDDKQQGADVTCGEPGVTRVDIGEPVGDCEGKGEGWWKGLATGGGAHGPTCGMSGWTVAV